MGIPSYVRMAVNVLTVKTYLQIKCSHQEIQSQCKKELIH